MIKPSDKVLIGWITLFAAFASTNLGQVSASELNATNPEPSASESILAAEPLLDQGVEDQAVASAHVQSTAPENDIQSPAVGVPSNPEVAAAVDGVGVPLSAEVATAADVPLSDNGAPTLDSLMATMAPPPIASEQSEVVANTGTEQIEPLVTAAPSSISPSLPNVSTQEAASNKAKLDHLVATATREIPVDSSLLAQGDRANKSSAPSPSVSPNISSGEETVTRGHPSAAPEIINIPVDALPTARVISPGSPVVEPAAVVEPVAVVEQPVAVVEPAAVVEQPVAVVEPVALPDEVVSPSPVVVDGISDDVAVDLDAVDPEVIVATADRPPLPVLTEMPTGALPTTRVMSPDAPQSTVESELGEDLGQSADRAEQGLFHASGSRTDAVSIQALKARVSQALAEADRVVLVETDRVAPAEEAVPRSVVMTPDAVSSETVASAEMSGSEIAVDTAQLPLEPPLQNLDAPTQEEVDELLRELNQPGATASRAYQSSPAITISNPSGFGVDNLTAFVGVGYQERTRFTNDDDGGLVLGVGLGDARENVGVQLSYTLASFGGSRDFGTGGFNAKIHRRLADDWSVALGWEGFATTGSVDFEDSIYGSVSHLIRTRDSITDPFSRVALTVGAGNGRFRTEEDVFDDRSNVNVFGSVAVRVAEPVSAIVEWTGQDLAAAVSITPFRDLPFVLLPAIRDITGAGDGSRFVLGAGVSFQL